MWGGGVLLFYYPESNLISKIYVKCKESEINLLNFMYKRKDNIRLLQNQPRELRRFEARVFIEYASNNNTFESSILFQGAHKWNALPVIEGNMHTYEGFKMCQRQKLKNKLLAM